MENYLEMRNISKNFSGIKALTNVNFSAYTNEIHGLVGENGAGKSTLMKILSGVYSYPDYEGKILLKGNVVKFNNTKDAEKNGIAIIHQELNLIPQLSVAENIFLGREPVKFPFRFIDNNKMFNDAGRLLSSLNFNINPKEKVENLSVGKQQMVEISKAISLDAKVLILDEPTSALTEKEAENLFLILKDLKNRDIAIIYISHKLEEIFRICDRITVLRDGMTVCTEAVGNFNKEKLISAMVGRSINNLYPTRKSNIGKELFRVEDFCVEHPFLPGEKIVKNVNFKVSEGEILGIFGLMGSGRSELLTGIFGAFPAETFGKVYIKNEYVKINSPIEAIKQGIGFVPEDRKNFGLILKLSTGNNISLASLHKISKFQVINNKKEKEVINRFIKELHIKITDDKNAVETLSGGNQQKVVLSKWLANAPRVLFLDEPTRGVDVGARFEIYQIINKLVEKGICIVMVSSELPEIMGMSDRIIVMCEGSIAGEFKKEEFDQEQIMACATGTMEKLSSKINDF